MKIVVVIDVGVTGAPLDQEGERQVIDALDQAAKRGDLTYSSMIRHIRIRGVAAHCNERTD